MVDKVTINNDPHNNPERNEAQAAHEAAMIAKAEGGASRIAGQPVKDGERVDLGSQYRTGEQVEAPTDDAPAKAERPENIPEKFWDAEQGTVNVEALLKAQADAEAALRAAQQGKDNEAGDEDNDPVEDAASDSAVAAAQAYYDQNGELGDEHYAALEAAGLDRNTVDAYIAGQEALVANLQSSAYSAFGGSEESYRDAQTWARNNLSDDEIAALDVQLSSDNPAIVKQGAAALAARYAQDADITPTKQIVGEGRNAESGSYFKSSKEMQTAMADPRYKNDAAFRQEVADKIARASAAGVPLF